MAHYDVYINVFRCDECFMKLYRCHAECIFYMYFCCILMEKDISLRPRKYVSMLKIYK